MNYLEQLKSPLWQKFRLKIFERDKFTCTCCKNKEKQLHAHHLYYLPNLKIWDHDKEAVKTVCEDCHQILTFELSKISGLIAFEILKGKIDLFKKIPNKIKSEVIIKPEIKIPKQTIKIKDIQKFNAF